MSVFQQEGNRLKYHYDAEELWLEPWGANSLRVRATKEAEMPKESWALLEAPECGAEIEITEDGARIKKRENPCGGEQVREDHLLQSKG